MKLPKWPTIAIGVIALAVLGYRLYRLVTEPVPPSGLVPSPTATVEDSLAMTAGIPPELAVTPSPSATAALIEPYADAHTLLALKHINLARLERGLWPLKPNSMLNRLAQGQAGYLATLRDIPQGDAAHLGAEGNDPLHRAIALGWPSYGPAENVEIGELAAAPSTPDLAVLVWSNNESSSAILFSDVYREVGVAVVPLPGRVVVVAVLGAQPGVLPALVEPASGMLYLTAERSPLAESGNWIGVPTRVQVLDQALGGSVTDDGWVGWQPTIPAPLTDKPFNVAFSDETWLVTTTVDPLADIVWLPAPVPTSTPSGTETVVVATATSEPSAAPPTQAGIPTSPPVVPPTVIPATAVPTLAPTVTKTSTPLPSATPVPLIAINGGLTLIYDEFQLAIVNTSGDFVDMQDLTIVGSSITLTGTLWNTPFISAPIDQFPSEDCLQVWAWSAPNPGKPTGCRFMRAAIYVAPSEMFWKDAPFDVHWQSVKKITCQPGADKCEFVIP